MVVAASPLRVRASKCPRFSSPGLLPWSTKNLLKLLRNESKSSPEDPENVCLNPVISFMGLRVNLECPVKVSVRLRFLRLCSSEISCEEESSLLPEDESPSLEEVWSL